MFNTLLFVTFIGLNPLQVPVHCSPLQNAKISKKKSDNWKSLQKMAESDGFATDNALHKLPSSDDKNFFF
jgi:hypothetical protein